MIREPILDRRATRRVSFAPMYTTVAARPTAIDGVLWFDGHAYDISTSGVRIELDSALPLGEEISMRIGLPGGEHELNVDGRVIWVNDESDDPGPRRMAIRFSNFATDADRIRLEEFVGGRFRQAAA